MIGRAAPLAAVVLLAGHGGALASPRVTVSPPRALVDEPVRIVVSGLKPHERIVVGASSRDLSGKRFAARAAIRADAHGDAQAPPLLLARMAPADPGSDFSDAIPWAGQTVTFTAGGAHARLRWLVRSTTVTRRAIRGPFYGDFFRLPAARPRPGVLLFGGAEGGLAVEAEAALLASRGFPTLALAYFGEPGLPAALSRIPLEYFERALRWLGAQPGVDPARLVVDGYSRGSEAALLLGIHDPRAHAVVALVPGNVVLCAYPGCGGPAWTLHGRPIPFQDSFGPGGDQPIPVERIRGRVLLVCGGGDLLWPSCPMAQAIRARRHGLPTQLLDYPNAGHGIANLLPNVPQRYAEGEGYSPLDNARARLDAWPKLLAFLGRPVR